MFHEHHSRSVLKASTWFVLAFTITFITLTLINGDWKAGLIEAALVQALKAFLYYIHERLWNKTNFGQKLKKPTLIMK